MKLLLLRPTIEDDARHVAADCYRYVLSFTGLLQTVLLSAKVN